MRRVVVYDFDKTLTYKDTLTGFFTHCAEKNVLYPLKLFVYGVAMVLAKFGFMDNTRLKKTGVKLFLQSKSRDEITECAGSYGDKIVFNKLFYEVTEGKETAGSDDTVCVVSASFEEYLTLLFSSKIVVNGSRLKYTNDRVSGLEINCYKDKKVQRLTEGGIKKIDILYTDSYSDAPLARISEKIVVVSGDRQTVYDNYKAFERHFQ